ncbi:nitroreductase family protein [Paenibacillus sp. FSL R7-0331]|uniref:nitroreductase family protein n=1 Tax=Paenibacillus sp. FSL R7-0331 TaxID=1536773 RepID=UPI0004F87917|nr:nitroreductase family protein [Paenibacillus sp. FSL R7-0331]AIQ54640.1 FMN reductase [Paenibacillus sp. FSL R7-0331]
MNEVLNILNNHRSFRKYADKPVEPEKLRSIIEAAQAAPSWVNGQQVTIIAVQNKERREQIALLSGKQQHVADAPVFLVFCMDFYRTKLAAELEGQPFEAGGDTDALLVGAVDVGIALEAAVAAAESLGLGIIPIGGIRRNTESVIGLLELPEYVFPLVGLCIGYPGEELPKKPRLPLEAVYHQERYNRDLEGSIRSYNAEFREYQKSAGQTERDWSAVIAHFYALNPQYGDAGKTLPKQGFTCGNLHKF